MKALKKQNNNITPPRSAIARSQAAILGIKSPPAANKLAIDNNPYSALTQGEEDEEEQDVEIPDPEENKTRKMTNEKATQQEGTEETASHLTEGSSPERKLLTKKAQQTLRKIRSLKNLLLDNSVRAEIEKVLGKGDIESISMDIINNGNKEEEEKEMEKSELSSDRDRNQADVEMENVENADNNSAKKTSEKPSATNQEEPKHSENTQAQSVDERSQGSSSISRDSPSSKNVSFAAAVTGQNSHHMRTGNLQGPQRKNPPPNPYLKPVGTQNNEDQGTLHILRQPSTPARPDKAITLKKNNSRQHIHRYTLRFKTIKAKSVYCASIS